MPQSERSQIIKQILSWLNARTKSKKPPKINEVYHYIESEICEMGASIRVIKGYLRRLEVHGFIRFDGLKVVCTQTGKNWLKKKVS